MMSRLVNRYVVLTLVFLLFLVTACSTSARTPEAAAAAPTIDTHEIVEAVLEEIESQLALSADTAVSTVDTDAISEAVVAEVESRLADQIAAALPTANADEIAEAVLAQVQSQLAEQRTTVSVGFDSTAAVSTAETLEDAFVAVYERANRAVVYIVVPSVGSGSGFVYNKEGYIVTNNHVVENGRNYEVVFSNGERRSAELVGTDVDSDLAVIRVDQLPDGVEPLPLAAPEDVRVGQLAIAIGNPFGEQGSMSLGIISGLDRSLRSQRASMSGSSYSLPQVIQTDAPINPGNSGGPLLNLKGEVVGVNSAIASTTGTNSGVGFSIPVAAVWQIVPSLVENGEYVYPFMGVGFEDEITLDEQSMFGLSQTQGAYVVNVTQGGPADEAGLIPANSSTGRSGDLVIKIDDREINDFSDLNSYLVFHTTVGQTIEMTVLRDGELLVLPLTLGARP